MSFQIVDTADNGADFATTLGLENLHVIARDLPALREFLEVGEASAELAQRVIRETAVKAQTRYISDLFRTMQPPIVLTDGTG